MKAQKLSAAERQLSETLCRLADAKSANADLLQQMDKLRDLCAKAYEVVAADARSLLEGEVYDGRLLAEEEVAIEIAYLGRLSIDLGEAGGITQ